MATLHVRNVPEPLYAILREAAEREGRSIGAQALFLLQHSLIPEAARASFPRRLLGARRFAESAGEIVERAQAAARELDAAAIEPGHLVLALLATEGRVRDALARLGIDREQLRERLGRGPGSPRRIPFSPEAKAALERALREALALKHSEIAGEHVLLALADDPLFEDVGRELVKTETLLALSTSVSFAAPADTPAPDYLAVDLDGDAGAWTARLNELAADGWELFQLVGGRAVLRRG